MTNINFLYGYPVEFKHLCMVYPPKVHDTFKKNFFLYSQILTLSQEEIEDEYVEKDLDISNLLTPFEYLLNTAYNDTTLRQFIKDAFYLFTHEDVTFLYEQKQIVIGDIKDVKSIEELRILREEDYFDFQNLVREAIGKKRVEPPNPNEDPRVKAIKAKARYRDKIKAKKGQGISLQTTLSSICCMGIGITPLNIGELSYAIIPVLIETYQAKEKYQLDTDCLLAGADAKKIKPKYWIRNFENN
jgi:hypothetical protein